MDLSWVGEADHQVLMTRLRWTMTMLQVVGSKSPFESLPPVQRLSLELAEWSQESEFAHLALVG